MGVNDTSKKEVWLVWKSFQLKVYSKEECTINGAKVNSTTPYLIDNVQGWLAITPDEGDRHLAYFTDSGWSGITPVLEGSSLGGFGITQDVALVEGRSESYSRYESTTQLTEEAWVIWGTHQLRIFSPIECTINGQTVNAQQPYTINNVNEWLWINPDTGDAHIAYSDNKGAWSGITPESPGAVFEGAGFSAGNMLPAVREDSANRYRSEFISSADHGIAWICWSSYSLKIYSPIECTIDGQTVNSSTPYVVNNARGWMSVNPDGGARNLSVGIGTDGWTGIYPYAAGATFGGVGLSADTALSEKRVDIYNRYESEFQYADTAWIYWSARQLKVYSPIECTINGQSVNSEHPYIIDNVQSWVWINPDGDNKHLAYFDISGNWIGIEPDAAGAVFAGVGLNSGTALPEVRYDNEGRYRSEFIDTKDHDAVWVYWSSYSLKIYSPIDCWINDQLVNSTTPYVVDNVKEWVALTPDNDNKYLAYYNSKDNYWSGITPEAEGATLKGFGISQTDALPESWNGNFNRYESAFVNAYDHDVVWIIWRNYSLKIYSPIECTIEGQTVNSTTPYVVADTREWSSMLPDGGDRRITIGVGESGWMDIVPTANGGNATLAGFGLTKGSPLPLHRADEWSRMESDWQNSDVAWVCWTGYSLKVYSPIECTIEGQTVNSTTPYVINDVETWISLNPDGGERHLAYYNTNGWMGITPTAENATFSGVGLTAGHPLNEKYSESASRYESEYQYGNIAWICWDNYTLSIYSSIECQINGQTVNSSTPYKVENVSLWYSLNYDDARGKQIECFVDGSWPAYTPAADGAVVGGFGLTPNNKISENRYDNEGRYRSVEQYGNVAWVVWDSYKITLSKGSQGDADKAIWLKYGSGYYTDNNNQPGDRITDNKVTPFTSTSEYDFLGWSLSGSRYINGDGSFDIGKMTTTAFDKPTTLNGDWQYRPLVTWKLPDGAKWSDGVSSNDKSERVTSGTAPTQSDIPIMDSAKFAGWNTDPTAQNGIMSGSLPAATNDVVYHAIFTNNDSFIVFDANEGIGSPEGIAGNSPDPIDTSKYVWPTTKPTRDGYTFEGWYTEKTGGVEVTAYPSNFTEGTTTYYAHWKANQYSVKFNFDDQEIYDDAKYEVASGTPSSVGFTLDDENVNLPGAPVREGGWKFNGWQLLDKDGNATGAPYCIDGKPGVMDIPALDSLVDNSVTMKALWEPMLAIAVPVIADGTTQWEKTNEVNLTVNKDDGVVNQDKSDVVTVRSQTPVGTSLTATSVPNIGSDASKDARALFVGSDTSQFLEVLKGTTLSLDYGIGDTYPLNVSSFNRNLTLDLMGNDVSNDYASSTIDVANLPGRGGADKACYLMGQLNIGWGLKNGVSLRLMEENEQPIRLTKIIWEVSVN